MNKSNVSKSASKATPPGPKSENPRADAKNSNNSAYKASQDNRSRQLNSNDVTFQKSREVK